MSSPKPNNLVFKPATLSIPQYCDICKKKKVFRCSCCHCACYCSNTCQRNDWLHKEVCKKFSESWNLLKEREALVKEVCGPHVLESNDDQYADHPEGLNYAATLMTFASELRKYDSPESIKHSIQLHLTLHSSPWSRIYKAFVGIPSDFIALGRDEEAYRFIKYHITGTISEDHEDISENLPQSNWNLHHLVALTLIKFRYFDKCLKKEKFQESFLLGIHSRVGKQSPIQRLAGIPGVLELIFNFYVGVGCFTYCRQYQRSQEISHQLHYLLSFFSNSSLSLFWYKLLDSERILQKPCPQIISGGGQQTRYYRLIESNWNSWKRNPNALTFVREWLLAREQEKEKES